MCLLIEDSHTKDSPQCLLLILSRHCSWHTYTNIARMAIKKVNEEEFSNVFWGSLWFAGVMQCRVGLVLSCLDLGLDLVLTPQSIGRILVLMPSGKRKAFPWDVCQIRDL